MIPDPTGGASPEDAVAERPRPWPPGAGAGGDDVCLFDGVAAEHGEAWFRAVFENARIGIGIADVTGTIVDANGGFAAILGYSLPELRRLRPDDFLYDDDGPSLHDLYRDVFTGRRDTVRVDKRFRRRDGTSVWVDLTASPVRDDTGAPRFIVALADDVTGRRELEERLRHQALHDPLTQLPNRTLFHERLAAAFADPANRVGVCYLDLDRFKAVNDTLGHLKGDALLVAVGERFGQVVRPRRHLVARMGGDEFVVLVENPVEGELARLADDLLAALADPLPADGHHLRVSASIGVIETAVADTTPTEVLKAADVSLYWAKAEGRNQWRWFDAERAAHDLTRYALADTLLPGLERGEFFLDYQPIVGLSDGRVRGAEALVRWDHPAFGLLGPDRFITVAEETGTIVPLGRWVLRNACAQAASWPAGGRDGDLFVSVNLAVRQAHEPGLVADVLAILDETGLAPERLQLEVTESALLGPTGRPVEALHELAAAGVRIAVDDFGTGYSNLGYLNRLPLHGIKLAGILVDGLSSGAPAADAVVTSLISLAHALGLTVTAEAVETTVQAAALRSAGCDTAQGFLYARPTPGPSLPPLRDGRLTA